MPNEELTTYNQITRIDELRTIIDFVSDGVLVTDEQSNVIMINKSHALLEFATPDEIIGKSIPRLVDEGYYVELKPIELTELKEFLLSKQSVNFEMITRLRRRLFITTKPILNAQGEIKYIVYTSRDITEMKRLRNELEKEAYLRNLYQQQLTKKIETNVYYSQNSQMKYVFDMVKKVSQVDSAVFITGKSGVGKGLVASKIHELGIRAPHPFIQINCAAIPDNLFESEIFGYEEGAFTGARKQGKPGLLELAGEGSVFLDEITELPISLQAKFLQILQEGEFRRVGGTSTIHLKCRIISATNQPIDELLKQGKFREDLYYRLCVVPIHVPSLSERRDEILPLAEIFLRRFNTKYGLNKQFSLEVKKWLHDYDWPGNVRELQNMVERMAIVSDSEFIEISDVTHVEHTSTSGGYYVSLEPDITLREANEKIEKMLIDRASQKYKNSREAAEALGVSQATYLRKAGKYAAD
ncbi:RNA polymerase sigma factor 54 interaction domain [Syntrophomonas zehnderi OL-4]|uniref:HTH-type transcriptional regulatory protein TyrR n=1 Tax=Syntrophomonas zehnderi OL-4 TaxID=690567 RepID=A0A0E3W3G6_9FIRM|nr:sigma 54-interacting transcriptional regulator [Syntrophomonas zehnderi]CFX81204.1 RNA polymerase sigma factor 54 interaction domain [Syntrophomonas zehnderi OL-4]